jgi:hypothetical protein
MITKEKIVFTEMMKRDVLIQKCIDLGCLNDPYFSQNMNQLSNWSLINNYINKLGVK